MCPLATILHWSEFTSGGGHALALRGHVREGQAGAAVLASCLKSNKETEAGGTEQNAWGLSGESGFVLPMTKLRKERSRHETLRQWWLEPQQEQPCNMGPAVEDQHKQCPGPRQAHGKASVPFWHGAKPEYVINTTPARDPGVNQELFFSLPVSTSFSFC